MPLARLGADLFDLARHIGEAARDLFRDTPDERLAMLGAVSAQAAGRLSNARR